MRCAGLVLGVALVSSGCVRPDAYSVSRGTSYQGTAVKVDGYSAGLFWLTEPDLDVTDDPKEKCTTGKVWVYVRATCNVWV